MFYQIRDAYNFLLLKHIYEYVPRNTQDMIMNGYTSLYWSQCWLITVFSDSKTDNTNVFFSFYYILITIHIHTGTGSSLAMSIKHYTSCRLHVSQLRARYVSDYKNIVINIGLISATSIWEQLILHKMILLFQIYTVYNWYKICYNKKINGQNPSVSYKVSR